jgi:hypothetical protein
MIEAIPVIEKLITMPLEWTSRRPDNQMQQDMLAALVREDLLSAGMNRRWEPSAKDRH